MLTDVVISVRSVHGYDRDEGDITEFTTDGLYSYDDGVACITYMESEVTGMEGTRTSVMVMPDKVVVDRDGNITSRMIFQQGIKNSFQYDTPFGSAVLGVDTRKLNHSFNEQGGRMEMDFVVDMEHAAVSRSNFTVTVSPSTCLEQQNLGGTANG